MYTEINPNDKNPKQKGQEVHTTVKKGGKDTIKEDLLDGSSVKVTCLGTTSTYKYPGGKKSLVIEGLKKASFH